MTRHLAADVPDGRDTSDLIFRASADATPCTAGDDPMTDRCIGGIEVLAQGPHGLAALPEVTVEVLDG